MNYSEKLKDPRWQKIRLEVLQRDNWACTHCKETTRTLHVHHCYYERGLDPWEYNPDSLITLCEDCHESEQRARDDFERVFLGVLRKKGVGVRGLYILTELFNESERRDIMYFLNTVDANIKR